MVILSFVDFDEKIEYVVSKKDILPVTYIFQIRHWYGISPVSHDYHHYTRRLYTCSTHLIRHDTHFTELS